MRFEKGARSPNGQRKIIFVTWTLLWLVVGTVGLEALSQWFLVPWHQEIINRHMQPYFMSGGYYQTPVPGLRNHEVVTGLGGPSTYGYEDKGSLYVYSFDDPVFSIADRGDFLFQDRAELANGARDRDIVRVFFIGGSAAYGIGASSKEKRWYAVLELMLSETLGREVRLVPAAMIGYVSTQERLILDLVVLPRRPDAVVIFNGFNDAVLPAIFGTRPGDPYDQGVLYKDFYSGLSGLKRSIARHSSFFRYLLHRSLSRALEQNERRILGNPELLKNYALSTAAVYLDNLRNMLERCQERKVPCAVFLQPVRDLTLKHQGVTDGLDPFAVRSYEQILASIKGDGIGFKIHDLTGAFNEPGREKWFVDNVHFRDPGHRAIAEAMYPVVLKALEGRM